MDIYLIPLVSGMNILVRVSKEEFHDFYRTHLNPREKRDYDTKQMVKDLKRN